MPLASQRRHTPVNYRLLATLTLPAKLASMTSYAPRIPIFLHKRRLRVKRVAALSAEEMTHVPGSPTSDNNFRLDGRFAAATARGVKFVKVKMAVEAQGRIAIVQRCLARLSFFLGH